MRFSDRATGNAQDYAKNSTVIHIEIDAAEIGKNIKPDISLCGDLRKILPLLLNKIQAKTNEQWLERIRLL